MHVPSRRAVPGRPRVPRGNRVSLMHPQLESEKRIVCKDLIQALDACHLSEWRRLTGQCNTAKNELNKCLHAETMKRASRNRQKAKENRHKVEQDWNDLHQDD